LVPNLRLEVLPQSSHWMQHDCPEQVNGLIKEFLQQQQTQ
jgi:pimeloyl-ACP methyl ester carboxylesterase